MADYPQLEAQDFLAVYAYAAELAAGNRVSSERIAKRTRGAVRDNPIVTGSSLGAPKGAGDSDEQMS